MSLQAPDDLGRITPSERLDDLLVLLKAAADPTIAEPDGGHEQHLADQRIERLAENAVPRGLVDGPMQAVIRLAALVDRRLVAPGDQAVGLLLQLVEYGVA